jgi:hypothetical protein
MYRILVLVYFSVSLNKTKKKKKSRNLTLRGGMAAIKGRGRTNGRLMMSQSWSLALISCYIRQHHIAAGNATMSIL